MNTVGRWRSALALATCLAAACSLACSRPQPSPEYERARALWTELSRADPQAGAVDPRSGEVLGLLSLVPAGSVDAEAASALRTRIQELRAEVAAERARREEVLHKAGVPSAPLAEVRVRAGAGTGTGGTDRAASRDATRPIAIGMTADEFRRASGTCFASGGSIALTPRDAPATPGELWLLKDDPSCREAHPGLVGQAIVVAGGSVASISPAKNVRRFEVRHDADLAKLPDGRPGMVVDGKLVPLPPGAKVVRTDGAGAP